MLNVCKIYKYIIINHRKNVCLCFFSCSSLFEKSFWREYTTFAFYTFFSLILYFSNCNWANLFHALPLSFCRFHIELYTRNSTIQLHNIIEKGVLRRLENIKKKERTTRDFVYLFPSIIFFNWIFSSRDISFRRTFRVRWIHIYRSLLCIDSVRI